MNTITLINVRLGNSPEIRYTPNGKGVVTLSVADSRKVKDQFETSWFKIVAWGDLAEYCQKNLKKGTPIAVIGNLTQRQYTDKNGQKRESVEINANSIKALVHVQKDNTNPGDDSHRDSQYDTGGGSMGGGADWTDENIPF